MKKKMKKSSPPHKAFGESAKKPASKVPGTDRGAMSKMPEGPSVGVKARAPMVHKARAARLKGIRI